MAGDVLTFSTVSTRSRWMKACVPGVRTSFESGLPGSSHELVPAAAMAMVVTLDTAPPGVNRHRYPATERGIGGNVGVDLIHTGAARAAPGIEDGCGLASDGTVTGVETLPAWALRYRET